MADETRHIGAEYLLGQLTTEERGGFEEALKRRDAIALHQLAEGRELLALLGHSTEGEAPNDRVRNRIFERIDHHMAPDERLLLYRRLLLKTRLLAAAVFVFAMISVLSFVYILTMSRQIGGRNAQITALEFELAISTAELAKKDHYLKIVKSPQTRVYTMNATSKFPGGSGKVMWNVNADEAVFMATGLTNKTSDKEWELWIIQAGKPVSAGVFKTDIYGQVVMELPKLPHSRKASTFAVTLEPKGGKPAPEGEIYIVGSL